MLAFLRARLAAPLPFFFGRPEDRSPISSELERPGPLDADAGFEPPPFADDEQSLAEAHARISRTLDYIDTVPVQAFDQAAERLITLPFGVPQMPAARYLHGFALPSLFFHVATAYAILRHRGVPLGKRDFLGNYLST